MILIGLDPGLGTSGWGVIAANGNRLSHIADGQIKTDPKAALPQRLVMLDAALTDIVLQYQPVSAGVEEVFQNTNPQSTLKLGQARGVILLGLARAGLIVDQLPQPVAQHTRHGARAHNVGHAFRPSARTVRLATARAY